MDLEQQKTRIIEEIETTLFFSNELNEIIFIILEDLEQYEKEINFDLFKEYLTSAIEMCFDDRVQWLIIKEYSTIENLNKIDFDQIEKEFFNDIKNCFDIVGV